MKNLLVLLVTAGIGGAYWYQLPDPVPAPAPAPPAVRIEPPVQRAPFVPAHTMLDDPAVRVGSRPRPSSVQIGTDSLK